MSITCKNTGRKPWKCLCPDCVADRHPDVHTQSPEAAESQAMAQKAHALQPYRPSREDWIRAVPVVDDGSLFQRLRDQIKREAAMSCYDPMLVWRICADCFIVDAAGLPFSVRVSLPRDEVKLSPSLRDKLDLAGQRYLKQRPGWLTDPFRVTFLPEMDAYRVEHGDTRFTFTGADLRALETDGMKPWAVSGLRPCVKYAGMRMFELPGAWARKAEIRDFPSEKLVKAFIGPIVLVFTYKDLQDPQPQGRLTHLPELYGAELFISRAEFDTVLAESGVSVRLRPLIEGEWRREPRRLSELEAQAEMEAGREVQVKADGTLWSM